jgi:hypothetical protein
MCRHPVQVARVSIVEHDPAAARKSGTQPCGSDKDQHRNAGFNAKPIIWIETRIACWGGTGARDTEAEKTYPSVDAPAQFAKAVLSALRIDVEPVTQDYIAVRCFRIEGVVVERPHLIERTEFLKPEIQDSLDSVGAEVIRHLGFGHVVWFGIPSSTLLRELFFRL